MRIVTVQMTDELYREILDHAIAIEAVEIPAFGGHIDENGTVAGMLIEFAKLELH